MAFPTIVTCIVCELVRPEESKFSLLGFHGIAPDVRIGLPEFPGVVEFLSFVLIGKRGEGGGIFEVDWDVVAPNHQTTWTGGFKQLNIHVNADARLNLIIRASNAAFPLSGIYQLHLRVDNQIHYSTEISLVPLQQAGDRSHRGSVTTPSM